MRKYPIDKSDDRLRVDADRILVNDVILPGEANPHKVGPWLITGLGSSPAALVWAKDEQKALDIAADADLLGEFAVAEEDIEDHEDTGGAIAHLGNYDDAFDIAHCNVRRLSWRDFPEETQEAIAMACEEGLEDLSEL